MSIEPMQQLAATLDSVLNPDPAEKRLGFVLLVYEFDALGPTGVSYMGNGDRDDVKRALENILEQWNGGQL